MISCSPLMISGLLHIAAAAPPVELLVPDLQQLQNRLAAAEAHRQGAQQIGVALGRIHNTMTLRDALACEIEEAVTLASRSAHFGAAQREFLQSARAEHQRLQRIAVAPTITPLLDAPIRDRLEALDAALQVEVSRWQIAGGWHARYVEPWYRRCRVASLTAVDGLAPIAPQTADEVEKPIAVLTTAPGVLCPEKRAVEAESVILLSSPAVCLAQDDSCACAPVVRWPGAVLAIEATVDDESTAASREEGR